LVALSAAPAGAEEVSRNVAMQAAAMSPIALNEEGVDAAVIEKKSKSQRSLRQEGKPEVTISLKVNCSFL
jgi:elongation factor Ts